MIRQSRKIQFIILLILVCLVGTMSIAYAVLSTTLNINGTAQVMDSSWDVHFSNVQVNPYSVSINPTIIDNDKITFSADLTTPGQFYKFTVDIVNSGSIDAMIESIIKNPELTADQKKYLKYEVEYVDGTPINESQILKAGETKTISILVSFRNDIPSSNLPKTEDNLNLEIRFIYAQATSVGIEVSNGSEKLVRVVNGNLNTAGSEICIKDECFYLMKNDGNYVTMLSKYNLYVAGKYDNVAWTAYGEEATGRQDSTMLGWTDYNNVYHGVSAYSNKNVEYAGSLVEEYANNYNEYLKTLGVNIIKTRLITIEELVSFGCSEGRFTCIDAPSWIYSTSYWTSSYLPNGTALWYVNSGGSISWGENNYTDARHRGVRVVVEIPLMDF